VLRKRCGWVGGLRWKRLSSQKFAKFSGRGLYQAARVTGQVGRICQDTWLARRGGDQAQVRHSEGQQVRVSKSGRGYGRRLDLYRRAIAGTRQCD
jgi:hypothetical protein